MIDSKVSDPKLKSTTAGVSEAHLPQRVEARQTAGSEPATEEIAALAYQLWVERGSPHGSHEEDWYQAEQVLRDKSQPKTKTATA